MAAEELSEGISLTKKLRMSSDLASQIHAYADSRHITFSAAVRYLCASSLARVAELNDDAPALPEPPTRPGRPPVAASVPEPAPYTEDEQAVADAFVQEHVPSNPAPVNCPECGRATDPVLECKSLLINTSKRTWACSCCNASGAY